MSTSSLITPIVSKTLTSQTTRNMKRGWADFKRKFTHSPHRIHFYHRLNDPYSFLLLQALPALLEDFDVHLNIEIVLDLPEETNPEPQLRQAYSLKDAHMLSQLYGLNFPDHPVPPNDEDTFKATSVLLAQRGTDNLLHKTLEVTETLWHCGTTTLQSCANRYGTLNKDQTASIIIKQKKGLMKAGHYMSGMLYYGGEWYWGLDRLHHLTNRLTEMGLQRNKQLHFKYDRGFSFYFDRYNTLKKRPKQTTDLDFYFSFRSPYSYLALERTFKLSDHYHVRLNMKPILPMVKRGLAVPIEKRRYILHDAKREADRLEIPFGKIVDPLPGIERCLAIYQYAYHKNLEREYVTSVMRGIWSEGVNVASDSGLAKLVKRAGLDWPMAKSYLRQNEWRSAIEQNQMELHALGMWGVPVFRYGDFITWGQDRLSSVEEAILKYQRPRTNPLQYQAK